MKLDSINWHAHARVDKFTLDQIEACRKALGLDREPISVELLAFCSPDEFIESDGNLLTRQGKKRLIDRFVETASTNGIVGATRGRIGVGNGTTAAADTDTNLSGASKYFQLLDSVPTVGTGSSSGVATFISTFGTAVGNFAWEEWGIDGGTASSSTVTSDTGTTPGLINHKIASLGTKTSSASWVFTVTITIT